MRRTMSLKGFLIILGLMLAVFLVLHLVLKGNLGRKAEQANAQRLALVRLEEENKELKERLSLVGTDAYIVASARDNYSYVNKDDIRFEFTNPEALYLYTDEEMDILVKELGE